MCLALDKLQSPLQVLDCLTVENGPTLDSVRDYFVHVFARENEAIKQVDWTRELSLPQTK